MPFPSPTFAFLDVSGGEMIVIMLIVLVFFGGEKLPGFARGLGKLLRELKRMASGVEQEIKRAMEEPPPPRTRVINPPDDDAVPPTPDPTPGHRIMAEPLPVEPEADAATAAPTNTTLPATTEASAVSGEISGPAVVAGSEPVVAPTPAKTEIKPAG